MQALRCLILDLDGTVTDSHAYTFAAFRHACSPYRMPPDDEEIYGRFGPDEAVILRELVGAAHATEALGRLHAYYSENVRDVRVHPEIPPLLETCRRMGVSRGLFTGRGRAATELLLCALGLETSFDAVVAGDDAAPKPAGDGVRLLLQRLRREPSETLLVGDSPLDLHAAVAAGVQAMLATWYARGATHGGTAWRRLESPLQLLPLLGRVAE